MVVMGFLSSSRSLCTLSTRVFRLFLVHFTVYRRCQPNQPHKYKISYYSGTKVFILPFVSVLAFFTLHVILCDTTGDQTRSDFPFDEIFRNLVPYSQKQW